jgi:hypothetical protein
MHEMSLAGGILKVIDDAPRATPSSAAPATCTSAPAAARVSVPGMSQARAIKLETDVLGANNRIAAQNRAHFAAHGVHRATTWCPAPARARPRCCAPPSRRCGGARRAAAGGDRGRPADQPRRRPHPRHRRAGDPGQHRQGLPPGRADGGRGLRAAAAARARWPRSWVTHHGHDHGHHAERRCCSSRTSATWSARPCGTWAKRPRWPSCR